MQIHALFLLTFSLSLTKFQNGQPENPKVRVKIKIWAQLINCILIRVQKYLNVPDILLL